MRVSFDPDKRVRTLKDRGLDFEDARRVFSGITVEIEDTRRNCDERRIICYGMLAGRMVVICYTARGAVRHVFRMRKANDREKARFSSRLEVGPRES
ncbi:MAG TPA: BrnT family toxin [Zeimonas sp.]